MPSKKGSLKFVPLPPPQVCTPAQNTWDPVGKSCVISLIETRLVHGPVAVHLFYHMLILFMPKRLQLSLHPLRGHKDSVISRDTGKQLPLSLLFPGLVIIS